MTAAVSQTAAAALANTTQQQSKAVIGAGAAFKHARLAHLCYFVLGTGLLVGWNAFLTASDYFNAVFPDRSIDRVFTVTYLPITLCLIGIVSRWPNVLWNGTTRILVGYSLFTLCCAAVPLIDVALVQQGATNTAYGLVLLCVVLVAVGDGIVQPTVFADAALLPDSYTQSVVMGLAASGVTIGVLRLITKGSLPQTLDGLRISTQAYFAASAAITAVATLLYRLVLPRLDVVQHYRSKLAEEEEHASAAAAAAAAASGQLDSRCGSPLSRDSCLNISVTSQRCQEQDVASLQRRWSGPGSPGATAATPLAAAAAGHHPHTRVSGVEGVSLPMQQQQQQPASIDLEAACISSAAAGTTSSWTAACEAADQQQQQQQQLIPQDVQLPHEQQQEQQRHNKQQYWQRPLPWQRQQPQACKQPEQVSYPDASCCPDSCSSNKISLGSSSSRLVVGQLSWTHILRLNWRLSAAGVVVYACTLSIFPGFLAENVHSAVLRDWYPVLLIFTYNVFDFLGRLPVPKLSQWHPRHSTVLGMSLSRLVTLIPLYAGLAVYGAPEPAFFLLTAALGASNGWLTTLIFCAAPRGLSPSAAELAGMINVFAELAGLNIGAYLGWLWTIGK